MKYEKSKNENPFNSRFAFAGLGTLSFARGQLSSMAN